ncbi:hypothetical protein QL285_070727 [Trifolium repens]|nr:hypothetical protein QL285_070727 [Trifolium repens]
MSCVSSCRALTSLKLSLPPGLYNRTSRGETLFPNSLNLPLLTNLDLKNFTFCGGESGCVEPFSIFTKLNSLVIRHCVVEDAQILNISSETLVNLTMCDNSTYPDLDKIELSAPSLRNFTFTNNRIVKIRGSGLSSIKLVNIDVSTRWYSDWVESALVLLSWLQDLVSVESLRVTSTFLQILSLVPDLLEVKLPSFCNLKSLEVELLPIPNRFLYRLMQNAMLKKVAAKSGKEADKLRKEFNAGLEPHPIPDGKVDFLRQNSPLAEVNLC